MTGSTPAPSGRPRRRGRRLGWALGLLVAGAAAAGGAASAQTANSLQSIVPADGASLDASPAAIVLSFNQELADDDTLTLSLACNNQIQNTGLPEVDPDGLVVTVAINNPLPKGNCFVSWFLKDGLGVMITQQTSSFGVTSEPAVAATGSATTEPFDRVPAVPIATGTEDEPGNPGSTGGALWLGRVVSTLAILVLFGSLAVIAIGWPEGPEYVVTVRFLRTVWIVGLVATLLFVVAYTADSTGSSLGSSLSPGAWFDLNDAGWPGRAALLRLVLVAASGWVAMFPERVMDPQSAMLAWSIPGLALVTVALSRVDGPAAPLGFLIGIVHVLAVAVWFGGAALVGRVVLAGPGEKDLIDATRAFARVSVPAVIAAAVTGVIQVIRLDGGELFSSSHGRVVLLKVVVVAAMLAVALAVRQQVTLRLDRARELTIPLAERFRRGFGAEVALGVVALAFSGWLVTLTPAQIDPYADETYLPGLTFADPASGLDARVYIGPGRVGLNGIKVEVDEPVEGITNLILRFVPPPGSNVSTIEQAIPLTTAGTAILDDSVGLPFVVPGTWTLELSASTASGVLEGATVTFAVTDENGDYVTIPPNAPAVPVQVELVDQSTTTAPFATTPVDPATGATVPPAVTPSG
ncbi:MAG TPA: CopD family protein [Ilumatobacter sp.]